MTRAQRALINKLRAYGHVELAQDVEDVLLEIEQEDNLAEYGAILLRSYPLEEAN